MTVTRSSLSLVTVIDSAFAASAAFFGLAPVVTVTSSAGVDVLNGFGRYQIL